MLIIRKSVGPAAAIIAGAIGFTSHKSLAPRLPAWFLKKRMWEKRRQQRFIKLHGGMRISYSVAGGCHGFFWNAF